MSDAATKEFGEQSAAQGVMGDPAVNIRLADPPPRADVDQLWDQLRAKDAQILMLQKKLAHFRSWVSGIQARVQQMNPQAIKNSKRLYIGGVPAETSEDDLKQFLNGLMIKAGALNAPGNAIISCKITQEKNYAFVELRSVEEASNAMAFDGVAFKETFLKIRRPSNYDIATAMMLGPVTPDPTMDTSTLDICRTVVEDSPNKLFVGGLPCDWGEEQVKEMLTPHGALKSFNLVMDKTTGKSKGYAFCEFQDDNVVDFVIKSLNQKKAGSKMLTVKRALEGSKQALAAGALGALRPNSLPLTPQGPSFASYQGLAQPYLAGLAGVYPSPTMPPTPPKSFQTGKNGDFVGASPALPGAGGAGPSSTPQASTPQPSVGGFGVGTIGNLW